MLWNITVFKTDRQIITKAIFTYITEQKMRKNKPGRSVRVHISFDFFVSYNRINRKYNNGNYCNWRYLRPSADKQTNRVKNKRNGFYCWKYTFVTLINDIHRKMATGEKRRRNEFLHQTHNDDRAVGGRWWENNDEQNLQTHAITISVEKY